MLIHLTNADRETVVYRILPLGRLLDIIVNSRITLVKPKLWDDPYENFLYKQQIYNDIGESLSLQKLENSIYGNCWTKNSNADFSWRVYAPNKDGVQIQTTVGLLHDHLNSNIPDNPTEYLKVGKVTYDTWENIRKLYEDRGALNHFEIIGSMSLFYKRSEFESENEYRVIADNPTLGEEEVWRIPIDPNYLIKKMVIEPRIGIEEAELFQKVIETQGYKGEIEHSQLYSSPQMKLILKTKDVS